MKPSEYQKLAGRTECNQEMSRTRMNGAGFPYPEQNDPLMPVRLNHAVVGLAGEVGELASQLQKWIYYGKALDRLNVAEEFGDCLWYIAEGLNALGVDMGEVMEKNIAKLKVRYPEKYSNTLAADENRNLEAEREALKMDGISAPTKMVIVKPERVEMGIVGEVSPGIIPPQPLPNDTFRRDTNTFGWTDEDGK